MHSLQVNPFNHNVLLAVTSNGVYRTSDRGQNWVQVTMPFTPSGWHTVFWDRANAGEVVISGPDMGGLFSTDPRAAVSYDGGQSWTGIDLNPRDAKEAIPRDVWGLDGQWYILAYSLYNYPMTQCHRSIFWRSGDHGQTWEAVCTWPRDYADSDRHVTGLWSDSFHLFGTCGSPIIESTNGGDNWSAGSFSVPGQEEIVADPVREGVLWVIAGTTSLYRSQTGASGFQQVFNAGSTDVRAVAVDGYEGIVYVGGNSRLMAYSLDGGESWTNAPLPLGGPVNANTNVLALAAELPSFIPPDRTLAPEDSCLANNPQGSAGHPVNTRTGNFTHQEVDVSIPTRGLSLTFQRSYNSLDTYAGPLGPGWTHNYNMHLEVVSDTITLMAPLGSRLTFNDNGDNTFTPWPGIRATLVRNPDDTYTLTRGDQIVYTFDAAGRLMSLSDSKGNTTTLTYTGDNLTAITAPDGRALTLAYDGQGRITLLTDPLNRTVSYAYDDAGNLASVTDALGHITTYAYDDSHRLTVITDANGHTYTNTYDDQGRVVSQTDGLGQTTTFTYEGGQTVITDPAGHVVTHTYDTIGELASVPDALGNTETYTYDENYNRTSVTDENGHTTQYEWNECGCNVTAITDALGHTTTMTYDGRNNLTSQTDALGHTTYYEYDEHNNLITVTNPLGGVTSYTYNDYGQVTSVTDENGQTTYYGYDSLGQRIAITDALGAVTRFGYDAVGRLITTTNPLGWVTVNEYDDGDRLVRVTVNYLAGQPQNYQDQYNLITEYAYDAAGNRTWVTDTLGRVTRTEYDAANRLVKTTVNYDPTRGQNAENQYNIITEYGYDEVGNQAWVTDTLGHVTRTEYDELNRPITITVNYVDGVYDPAHPDEDVITIYAYDAVGNRVQVIDALGHVTRTEYDELNRPITVTNPLSGTTVSAYDALGRLVSTSDALGRVTTYEYDALGRVVTTTDALGGQVVYAYDAAGNRTAVTDANGHATTYEYDALNRLHRVTDAGGGVTEYAYDALGNRTAITDANGHVTTYEYDALNRLHRVTDAGGGVTEYAYDALGNRTAITDANGHVTTYEYDALNRLHRVTDPLSRVTRYTYDALGNRLAVTDPSSQTTSYTYDARNRLLAVTDPLSHATGYSYDALGNRVRQTDANGVVTAYGYDALNRLITVTENFVDGVPSTTITNVVTTYGYDAVGNRTAVTDANGHVTTYEYDALNRLQRVTDPLGNTTQYAYDAVGNRTVVTDANGAVLHYIYDGANRLTTIQYPDSNVQYAYDGVGNRVAMTDTTGTTTYVYDAVNRLIQTTDGAGQVVSYDYDAVGNRTQLVYPAGQVVTYTYDAANQLTGVTDWDGQNVSYTYDAAGRLTGVSLPNGTTTTYTYDTAGRLVNLTHSRGIEVLSAFTYTLDAVGNRIQAVETIREPGGTAFLPGAEYGLVSNDEVLPVAARLPGLSALLPPGQVTPTLTSTPTPFFTPTLPFTPTPSSTPLLTQATEAPATIVLKADRAEMYANGQSRAAILVQVFDAQGQAVADGTAVTLSTDRGKLTPEHTTTRDGQAWVTLTAGTDPGPATITAQAGDARGQAVVTLVSPPTGSLRVTISRAADPAGAALAEATRHPLQGETDGTALVEDTAYRARFTVGGLEFVLKSRGKGEKARLGISLEQVRLGETVLYEAGTGERRPPAARGNRAHYPRGEMVIEEYAALDAGVEQSFIITRLPAGASQDLVIELALQTDLKPAVGAQRAAPLPTDAQGIVFLDGEGQEVLAYGRATMRDASGRETMARLALEGTRLSLTVPGEWLAGATYPLLVDPLIGDPVLVCGGGQYSGDPAVAYNSEDDEWLVVWKDGRDGGDKNLYGRRVRSDGTLAGDDFAIVTVSGLQGWPAVAYNPAAGEYLVVWQDARVSGEWHVYGQRVAADGTLVGSEIAIYAAPYYQLGPAVTYQPATEEWLVVWHGQRPDGIRVYGQRISSAGALVGSNFVISQQGYSHRGPDVAANPQAGEYLAVWHMHTNDLNYSLRARRVQADGTLLGDEMIIAAAGKDSPEPRVEYNGKDDEYLVVWQDDRNGNWDIYGQRVSAGGELLGNNFAISSLAGDETRPSLAWDGNSERYLVGWQGWGLGQRVWADGTLDGGPIDPSASVNSPDHAYGEISGIILGVGEIYGDIYAQRYAIPVARFSATPLSGTVPLTVTFSNQSLPTVGLDGFEWAFGDGATSAEESPTHVYTATGVYTVELTVSSGEESDTATKTGYITVTGEGPAAPVANFSAEPLSGTVPLTVTFTNQSSGEITAYEWAFGDGLTDTITHPVHVYATTGVYTVSLTATGPGGTDTLTRTNYITATAPEVVETRVISYTYDPLYRLTSAEYSTGESFQYVYDAVGNRLAMTTSNGSTSYEYDAANRLTNVDGVPYTWDNNGNLLSDGTRTFQYDYANRLVQVVSGTLTTEFTYNGDGHRVAKTVNGTQTRYTLDPAMGLVQVLVEVTGGEATTYLYGLDLLAEETTAWAWHLNDGLGSVRQLADDAGQVTLAQGYTPFGVLLWYEGSAASAYGYTGEQEDASTGLVFLRARYYDPRTGRFISKDPFPGYVREPQTLNLYVYVTNNPLGHVDPAGLQGEDWLYHLSAFITGGLTQFSLDMTLVPQDAPPGSYWLEAQPVSFQWGRLGGRLGSTLAGLLEMWSGGNLILGGGLTVGVSPAVPPAVAVGGGELVAGTALVGHGTLVILHNVDPRNQIAMATGGCGSDQGDTSEGHGGGNVRPRVSRSDGGYEKGMMTDPEFEGVKKVAKKWNRPIDICGGFAETERGLINRAANDASVPEWRRGKLPTWTGDLDVSQITFEGLPPEQAAQLRADLLDAFKDAGVTTIDWRGYSTDLYPAGPMNPEGQPYGSIRFYPDGTTRRVLGPWQ
ncbi:MAG: PKD domain-containing protein [Anaerolineae bacterium]|nr:PKD domain-containing protein [Anaerolineae bacterium]